MKKTFDVKVPDVVDYDKVFQIAERHFKPNPTTKQRLKNHDAIYLFLSYLYPSLYYSNKARTNGIYRFIKSDDFNAITNNLLKAVVNTLTDDDYPVIEVNHSYMAGRYSKSYRLPWKLYWETLSKKVIITGTIAKNYFLALERNGISVNEYEFAEKENFLIKSYRPEVITLSNKAETFVDKLELELMRRIDAYTCKLPKHRAYLSDNIDLKLNIMRRSILCIKAGEFAEKLTESNGRLYSVTTQMSKHLRKYILINGNEVAEVDISNSHLFMLHLVLRRNFFMQTSNLNATIIYPELAKLLINPKEMRHNEFYSRKIGAMAYNKEDRSHLGIDIPTACDLYLGKSDIQKFCDLPFNGDIYQNLNNMLFDGQEERDYIKKNVMHFLNMKTNRDRNKFIVAMRREFPNVEGFIRMINATNPRKGMLALLLQRLEGYLMLDVALKEVNQQSPELDYMTVHDSIMVEKQYAEQVRTSIINSIKKVTDEEIYIKVKNVADPINNIQEIADEIFDSSRKVANRQRKKDLKRKKVHKNMAGRKPFI